jgi:uncharacterized OB-fold protein
MSEEKEISVFNYLDFIKVKKLMGSKCSCGHVDLPPRNICSECLGTETSWIDLTDKQGTLSTFSCVHVGTTSFVKRGYNMKNPYAFGIVTLENGPSITGLLKGVNAKDPDSIKIGMKFKVTFIETTVGEDGTETMVDLGFEPV